MEEFTAYRILYYIHMNNASAMTLLLATLADSPLPRRPAVAHALSVRAAYATRNYHRFFQLYQVRTARGAHGRRRPTWAGTSWTCSCPRSARPRSRPSSDRETVLTLLMPRYRPSVSLDFVRAELALPSVAECIAFVRGVQDMRIVLTSDGAGVDCKESCTLTAAAAAD